jgi:phosphate transport system substrate-binding protein
MKLWRYALVGVLSVWLAGQVNAADVAGAGATFPYPLYAKWAEAYKAESGVGLNYQSIGSGGGIKQIKARTVTFGASDMPLDKKDLDAGGLVQWPQIIGGVVPVVNLPTSAKETLTLDAVTLADLYLGTITTWDDPKVAALNPNVKLPHLAVAPVYRADGSGTTYMFTHYLSQAVPVFSTRVGNAAMVEWPVGIGAKGNEGVAAIAKQTQGAIAYVEYAYAKQNKLTTVKLVNHDGHSVAPDRASFQAAAANATWDKAEAFNLMLTNQPGLNSWPITGASFILMPKKPGDKAAAKQALAFFTWAFDKGAVEAEALDYVPLPPSLIERVKASWAKIEVKP